MIVGMNPNRVIGHQGDIPWHSKEDMKFFRRATIGHAVIMGRLTYESLPKRPLRDRTNIVVSRTIKSLPGCDVTNSVVQGIELARRVDPCPFVIGGAQIYKEALPFTTHLYLTELDLEAEGDTFFPELSSSDWKLHRQHQVSNCSFQLWTRTSDRSQT